MTLAAIKNSTCGTGNTEQPLVLPMSIAPFSSAKKQAPRAMINALPRFARGVQYRNENLRESLSVQ